jgi:hypothetical protein
VIVVASIFRNAAHYVNRYFEQIERLRDDYRVRLVIAEGDSDDDTYELLDKHLLDNDTLLKVDHGGPVFGSVDNPQRWAQIAYVCNEVLRHLDMKDDEKLIYVESDLLWPVDTMHYLIHDLDTVGAVAAMSLHPSTGRFYDIWGHVGMDGERFTPTPPFHPSIADVKSGRLALIQSAGSCIAVRGEIVNKGVEFSNEDCIRGFCRTIRDHTPLFLDPDAVVFHG